jgi:hypothetical protein
LKVMDIKPYEQEGKANFCLKLECHNSNYLCTAQNKETCEINLVIKSNKEIEINSKIS